MNAYIDEFETIVVSKDSFEKFINFEISLDYLLNDIDESKKNLEIRFYESDEIKINKEYLDRIIEKYKNKEISEKQIREWVKVIRKSGSVVYNYGPSNIYRDYLHFQFETLNMSSKYW